MTELLQYLASGTALGAVYALVALGFVVIYRASQVFNFAHGELLTFGAALMVWMSSPPLEPGADAFALGSTGLDGLGLPWALAAGLAVVATGALAALIERLVLRPLVGRPVFVSIILTLFVGVLLRTAMLLGFGAQPLPLGTPWAPMANVRVGGAVIGYDALATIAVGGAALALFFVLMRKTRLGIAMRATSADQETALALGIPVGRVFGATWFLAGAFAALGGIFLGVREPAVDMNLGYIALRAFPAVIVGGLDSAGGAVLAGLALGILEVLTAGYVNDALGVFGKNLHVVMPYLVMIAFLVVRPYGLFGREKVERL